MSFHGAPKSITNKIAVESASGSAENAARMKDSLYFGDHRFMVATLQALVLSSERR